MKRIIIDLDNTLCFTAEDKSGQANYSDAKPVAAVIEKLRLYRELGYSIVIHTSRNMRTYGGQVGLINVHTLPTILHWLDQHDVPYDEVVVGKPWPGTYGFYVDDRAIRPSEFAKLTAQQVDDLLAREKPPAQ